MKQSTKLLSLVLALVMAFSCFSVIGNAALAKENVTYDSIDDAALTPEQVADIALDLVEGLLADADISLDIVVAELDLRSVNRAFETLNKVGRGTLLGLAAAIVDLGVIEDLSFTALGPSANKAYQRSDGNLVIVKQLLQFLADNAYNLSPIAYGLNTSNGVSLGLIGSIVGDDLAEIEDMLSDLPGMLKEMLYDLLLAGSYSHPMNAEELKAAGQGLPYGGNLDTMLNNALLNLLITPQDYDWIDDEKVWDESSIIVPALKAEAEAKGRDSVIANFDVTTKSVFDILDYAAQYAIDGLGVTALNNNLKKALMEAVDVEFNEIKEDLLPADVAEVFADESAYVTYIAYDCLEQSAEDGDWYYTTLKTVTETDPSGNPVLDEEGNEVSVRKRLYYKANTAVANEFYNLINWNYEILKSTDPEADGINSIDYGAMIDEYGSITEALNHIIYIVYENAINEEVKEEFIEVTGDGWIDGSTSENINYNIERLLKYLLSNFADKIFGSDSPYADEEVYNYDFYADMSLIDIIALIGPTFFDGVMPQLIIPTDADGAFAFATSDGETSVAILQFGALVLREFMTEITPNVNYDEFIFDDITSADGRQFADHDAETWFNLILNMGVDIGYTYLGNITNFGDEFTYTADGTAFATKSYRTTTLPTAPASFDEATSEARWQGMLDEAIIWAVRYVGQGSSGVLTGINPTAVEAQDGPFNKLSYVLNTLLPLGFVNGCESDNYDLDLEVFFGKLKEFLTTFDLTILSSLFGRNGLDGDELKKGNILAQPVVPMALNLVNSILYLVFGANIFPLDSTPTLNEVLTKANLKTIVEVLLTRLNAVKTPLLQSALPVVGKLIKGWGTEQTFSSPDMSMQTNLDLEGGSLAADQNDGIIVKNGAEGVWRSWVDESGRHQDEQYKIKLTSVKPLEFDGKTAAAGVTITELDTNNFIDYGKDYTIKYSVSGVTANKIVRFDVSYQVYEGSSLMSNDIYTTSLYTYLIAKETDEGGQNNVVSDSINMGVYSPRYIDLNGDVWQQIQDASLVYIRRKHSDRIYQIKVTGTGADGITPGSVAFVDSGDYLGTNTERNWDPLRVFTNGDYNSSDGDKPLRVSGAGFDSSKFNETSGGSTEFSFSFSASKGNSTCGDKNEFVTGSAKTTVIYYDSAARNALSPETSDELKMGRIAADYTSTGYSYADEVLTYTTYTDEAGKVVKKNTNFNTVAWVNGEGVEVAGVTPDPENEQIGTYIDADGEEQSAKLVTKIDNSKVWATYVSALNAAADAAWSPLRADGNFKYEEAKLALEVATNDLGYAAAEESASGAAVGGAINSLKTTLDNVEAATTDKYDYTDYMMWRINRFNDAREDAAYYINLKKDADRVYADVNAKFPYTSIEKDDLTALVGLAENAEAIGANGNLILALLEDLTAEERASKEEWLKNKDKEYSNVTAFDVALAQSLLEKTSTRLRDREYKVDGKADTTYLATEIASAEAMITDSSLYTERSWVKYEAALETAKAVLAKGDSQKEAFDAKWELLCCRNELVLIEEEADYSELETLIEQAKYALANQTLYNNTAKELGQVLAELGIEGTVVNANGDAINLFPGSAVYTNTEPYTTEDQDIIDSAARDLKEALARLKFKALDIKGNNVAIEESATIVFDNPETEEIETVTSRIATIAAGLNEDAVKALFDVEATGATVGADNITISKDLHYSIDRFDEDGNVIGFEGFAGTNAVVTFYTVQGGIKIPVATVKLVVKGDINGDGTVDVIDCAQLSLVATDKADLDGCYFIAGNQAGATDDTRVIDDADYSAVVNDILKVS